MEKTTDASISRSIFDTCTDLSVLYQINDIHIVDQGFRDVIEEFQGLGHDANMPDFLSKGVSQLPAMDAKESPMITKCRWVMESFHACFKKWRFSSELLTIGTVIRIVVASLNEYRPIIYDGKLTKHANTVQQMRSLSNHQSHIEELVSSGQLSLRKKLD